MLNIDDIKTDTVEMGTINLENQKIVGHVLRSLQRMQMVRIEICFVHRRTSCDVFRALTFECFQLEYHSHFYRI